MMLTIKCILIFLSIFLGLVSIYYLGYVCGRADTFAEVANAVLEILGECDQDA